MVFLQTDRAKRLLCPRFLCEGAFKREKLLLCGKELISSQQSLHLSMHPKVSSANEIAQGFIHATCIPIYIDSYEQSL